MASDIGGPARFCAAVVLDAVMTAPTRAVLVGVAGNLTCRFAEQGNVVTIPVIAGYNPIQVDRIDTAGTTATGLFRLW